MLGNNFLRLKKFKLEMERLYNNIKIKIKIKMRISNNKRKKLFIKRNLSLTY